MLAPLQGVGAVRHVLVVDDEADVCRLVQSTLERNAGYRVTIALSGTEAVPLLEEPQPDLVILDAVLPGVSGLEIAELAAAKGIPILLATGDDDMAHRLRNDGWPLLRKPFRPATLRHEVEAALREAEANRPRMGKSPTRLASDRPEIENLMRRHREPRREARTLLNEAQTRSLLEEDPDTVRAAFHMLENFAERAADVADQRAKSASAEDVAKRWLQVARAIRKLRPKL